MSYCVCLVVTKQDLKFEQNLFIEILAVHASSVCSCTRIWNDSNKSFGLSKAYASIFGSIHPFVDEIIKATHSWNFLLSYVWRQLTGKKKVCTQKNTKTTKTSTDKVIIRWLIFFINHQFYLLSL